ncbi:MAG: hypothetical protein HY681_04790 [Chloroflexi bacterium]|nr:hypothetical protein [Chloroflexota bacterium]
MAKVFGYGLAHGVVGAVIGGMLIGLWGWYQDKSNPTGWGAVYTVVFALMGMVGGGALGAVVGGVRAMRGGGGGKGHAKAGGEHKPSKAKAAAHPPARARRRKNKKR